MITIELKDENNYIEKLNKIDMNLNNAISNAFSKSILLLERESKLRTPVKTGNLRASYKANIYPKKAELYPSVNYAWAVHEREFTKSGKKVFHKVGEAKFMTKALAFSIKTIQKWFQDAVNKVLS